MSDRRGLRAGAVALGCMVAGAAQAAASSEALHECRIDGLPHSVQCGEVRRALDPAQRDGPQISVHYVVVPALARRKRPDPVFLLAGGPGQSAIALAPQAMAAFFDRLHNRRDIVFVDQRGTGRSAPLVCPQARDDGLTDAEHQVQAMMACKASLAKLPYVRTEANLGAFTTTLAMQDLDAVRRALGVARIDLVGVSYGTRAALEYMRLFPQAVRRSVLDSVAPPDMALPASFSIDNQAALDGMLKACEREAACHQAYPDLHAEWEHLLEGLPHRATVPNPLSGAPQSIVLTRSGVLAAARGALYAPMTLAALPAAIHAAAMGHAEGLLTLGSLLTSTRPEDRIAMGMHFSVVCAEDVPLLDRSHDAAGTDFGRDDEQLYRRVCSQWPRGAVPAGFYTIPRTTTPTLLLSGGLDPATPPRHAARVAAALGPAAQLVVVPHAGHGVLAVGCAPELLFHFIDADDAAARRPVDARCLQSVPQPLAFLPITPASGGSR